MDGIIVVEALASQKRLSTILTFKLKREYSELCCFVQARMSITIVKSKSLLLRGPRDKDACIWQQPDLLYGSVMEIIAPLRGYRAGRQTKTTDIQEDG